MDEKKIPQPGEINIELDEQVGQGIYSNLAIISHSNSEFVIDFVRLMPAMPKAKVQSRIILTPEHAKRLLMALKENIQKFESQFGVIRIVDAPPIPMNFGGPKGEA